MCFLSHTYGHPLRLNTSISIHTNMNTYLHCIMHILYRKSTFFWTSSNWNFCTTITTSKCVDHVKYVENLCSTSHEIAGSVARLQREKKIKWKTASAQRQIVNMHVIRHGNTIVQLNADGMNDVRHTYHKIILDWDYDIRGSFEYLPRWKTRANQRPRSVAIKFRLPVVLVRETRTLRCIATAPLLYKKRSTFSYG